MQRFGEKPRISMKLRAFSTAKHQRTWNPIEMYMRVLFCTCYLTWAIHVSGTLGIPITDHVTHLGILITCPAFRTVSEVIEAVFYTDSLVADVCEIGRTILANSTMCQMWPPAHSCLENRKIMFQKIDFLSWSAVAKAFAWTMYPVMRRILLYKWACRCTYAQFSL